VTPIPDSLREVVFDRARGQCEYCRLEQRSQVATFPLDHILPRSLRGATDADNLALACPKCNTLKWLNVESIDPQTGEICRLFNPRVDAWEEHFRWSSGDQLKIDPLTAIGRATIQLLALNSPSRIEIRQWLAVLGRHPPTT